MGPTIATPASVHRYCSAHFVSYKPAESTVLNWKNFLRNATGSSSNNINELEMAWLGGSGTLADRWGAYLKANGYCAAGTNFREELRRYFQVF